ncbi:hypothetical protein ACIRL2_01445 [Embleya sp. NPDC127516]|uniref:hypothetical protein n=1 Tax=Embleya sp. NPDC127516 TaxID=3363990 RepID=UPI003809848E
MIRKSSMLILLGMAAVSCSGGDNPEHSAHAPSGPVAQRPPVAVSSPLPPVPAISEADARTTVLEYWAAKKAAFDGLDISLIRDLEDGTPLATDTNRIARIKQYGQKSPTLFYHPVSVSDVRIFNTGVTPVGADRYFLSSQRIVGVQERVATMYVVFRQSGGAGKWKAIHSSVVWAEKVNPDPLPASGTTLTTVPGVDAACGALVDLLNDRAPRDGYWGASGAAAQKSRLWRVRDTKEGGTKSAVNAELSADDQGPVWILPSGTRIAPCGTVEKWTFTPPEKSCMSWANTWGDEQFYDRPVVWTAYGESLEAGNYGLSIPGDGKPVDILTLQWSGLGIRSDDCPASYRHVDY